MNSLQSSGDLSPDDVLSSHCLALVLIGVLAVTLLPAWGLGPGFFSAAGEARASQAGDAFYRMVNQLSSFYLLPAMGFWLALRRGAVDLSVWAVAGMGGVLAAMLVNAGAAPVVAVGLAILAGLAVGAVNGLVAARTRLSSPAFTLIVAAIIVGAAGYLAPQRALRVPDDTFSLRLAPIDSAATAGSHVFGYFSSEQMRMLFVAVTYSAAMVVMVLWSVFARRGHWSGADRAGTFVALAASGALAAAGGAFWLVEHGTAPVPTRLIGDLRIPAAAILAGGVLWIGRGRTLWSGLALPISVLLTTAWRQEVTVLAFLRSSGYAMQLLVLAAMLGSAHLALFTVRTCRGPWRTVGAAGLGLIVATLAATASQALLASPAARRAVQLVCLCLWAVAAGAVICAALRAAPGQRPPHRPPPWA